MRRSSVLSLSLQLVFPAITYNRTIVGNPCLHIFPLQIEGTTNVYKFQTPSLFPIGYCARPWRVDVARVFVVLAQWVKKILIQQSSSIDYRVRFF